MKLSQILSFHGELNRRDYILWGLLLFALKYNLDRIVSLGIFDRNWYIIDYFVLPDRISEADMAYDEFNFYIALLASSLPFIFLGTILTVKRLRNASLSRWLVLLFFLPFLNIVFFIILSAIPERSIKPTNESFLRRALPKSKIGSALMALGLSCLIAILLTLLFTHWITDYGWSLFVGTPFLIGFVSILIYGKHNEVSFSSGLGVFLSSLLLFNLLIFILAVEGFICLAMAFPIMFIIGGIGALVAYMILKDRRQVSLNLFASPILMIVLLGVIENIQDREPPILKVDTSVIIEAPKELIWKELVAFSQIPDPDEFIFQTGIAYPTHALIEGEGVGAVRRCNFTTGAFIEPITVWDEPNRLAFDVMDQPPPMSEMSIYQDLDLEHLDGYFQSEKGQFLLKDLGDGRVELIGTTWYKHDIWPNAYWSLWSDAILHQIHYRVLEHIKEQAESK